MISTNISALIMAEPKTVFIRCYWTAVRLSWSGTEIRCSDTLCLRLYIKIWKEKPSCHYSRYFISLKIKAAHKHGTIKSGLSSTFMKSSNKQSSKLVKMMMVTNLECLLNIISNTLSIIKMTVLCICLKVLWRIRKIQEIFSIIMKFQSILRMIYFKF